MGLSGISISQKTCTIHSLPAIGHSQFHRSSSFPHAFSGNPGGRIGPPLDRCGVSYFCVTVLAETLAVLLLKQ